MLVICVITHSQGERNYYMHLQIPRSLKQSHSPLCQSLAIVPPAPYLGCETTGFIFKDNFKRAHCL